MSHRVIVDGNSIAHWRFWATPMSGPDAMLQSFVEWLHNVERGLEASHVDVCFDAASNWRYELRPDYKGTRTEKHPALVDQLARMVRYVDEHASNRTLTYRRDGFEADDLCAALVADGAFERATVISRDKDLRQLVDDARGVRVFDPVARAFYDEAAVRRKHLVYPHRLRDLLAIAGDDSDNVKGAPQWGEKTAADAINETIDFDHLLDEARELRLTSVSETKQRGLRACEERIKQNYEIVGFRTP